MSTAQSVVDAALNMLNAKSSVINPDSTVEDGCFQELRKTLAYLEKKRIILEETQDDGTVLTVSIPDLITDELNEPLSATSDLETFLAVRYAAQIRVPLEPVMLLKEKKAFNDLAQNFRKPVTPIADQSTLLSRGQGYRQFKRGSRHVSTFFDND